MEGHQDPGGTKAGCINEFAPAPLGQWISWAQAARLIGCSDKTIQAAAIAGQIRRRPGSRPRGWASLESESVQAYAKVWGAQQAARAVKQAARKAEAAARSRTPPDNDEVWLSSAQVSTLLRVSVGRSTN